MARFDGKPVIKTSVTNGINKPEELIQKLLTAKLPFITQMTKKKAL